MLKEFLSWRRDMRMQLKTTLKVRPSTETAVCMQHPIEGVYRFSFSVT